LIFGNTQTNLGHISGTRDSGSDGIRSKRKLSYVIKANGANAKAILIVASEKGGKVQETLNIN